MGEARETRWLVEEEGLVGTLFCRTTPGPHPAVIALGGAGGGLREGGAEALASEGFAALALAYFGVEPLPRELVEIPLEYFEKAIEWVKSQPEVDANRIAVVGNSKGGELALLLGATYPEDVKAVVGYVPSGIVWQGVSFDRWSYFREPRSSWSLGGEPLPFVRFARPRFSEMIRMIGFFFGKPPALGPIFYEPALEDEAAVAAASIAVEKINGPVLVISGTDDQVWPSTRLSEMVIERLQAHHHPFPYEHLRYEGAGHMISMPRSGQETPQARRFKLGGSQEADEYASTASWQKVLGFLKKSLSLGKEEGLGE